MRTHSYRPVRYFVTVFAFTWAFWIAAAVLGEGAGEGTRLLLMILGLFVPTVTTLITVLGSKDPALKRDFREKIVGFHRIHPASILISIALMGLIIAASILLSLLFGQSLDQFSFVDGFSFSIGGIPTLLTLVLTASLEEFGWRGYAQDSLANRHNWFTATMIFSVLWGLWHLPLFLIPDTYQHGILQMNPWYMVNFFAGFPPMAILFSWIYAKNGRSIFACMFFHFFVNFLQEQIAMTQMTKCVETGVVYLAAAIVVLANQKLFFGRRHIGNILGLPETKADFSA